MQSKKILVSGRVQGVGFRNFVLKNALELGIHGWVRNLPDGRVEIQAQGPEKIFENFLNQIRKGPPLSQVDHLDISEIAGQIADDSFTIK